ncbi:MNIO family bufferin maturase [Planktotalea sp.]|uniref:MNIO family bufferin maturase n=1 Tax=Planktotalea sp. TaxID=2029877 RepID=UPI003D6A9C62
MQDPTAFASHVSALPKLGLGVGLRNEHFNHILSERPDVDWFEAISENFMDSGGRPGWVIRQIAKHYPVVLHGVSMSIGSTDPLNEDYLKKLKTLADDVQAKWVSDHLCWTGVLSVNSHDLLPLPLNQETLNHVIARVHHVQETLARPLILENPSTYASFQNSDISEPDFLRAMSDATGCGLLLDVNNVYVSCFNDGSDPLDYLNAFPFERVVQMHLAGHTHCGSYLLDTHDQPVTHGVWELFRLAWQRTNGASTLLEWDGDVPAFADLHQEVLKARAFMQGEVDALRLYQEQAPSPQPSVSNPVDFIVPGVREHSRLGS